MTISILEMVFKGEIPLKIYYQVCAKVIVLNG